MIVETRIHELLSRWEAEDGKPSPEELCVGCPELLPRVRDYISRLRSSDRHLSPGEESDPTRPAIPGYTILGQVGRGGMGIVWRAEQVATKRPIALKIISAGEFASPRARARFEREVELASRLTHPNIARVYDSGANEGLLYYAMELIDGVPLDRYVESNNLSRRQILGLMIPICAAVQHAHQFGVIHRDLKPSNILVDAQGQPHLLDFGLAKEIWADDSPQITLDDAPGTPAYMSPEQASGKLKLVGTGSDIYTLGVIAYLLLLKRYPHNVEGTSIEVMHRIASEEPARPRAVDPTLPRDLEALLLKVLARTPDERYPSADALAADIGAWLEGRPIAPLRASRWYVLWKLILRHRYKILTGLGIVVVIVGIAAFAYVNITRARNQAQTEAKISQAVNTFLLDMLASADPEAAGGPVPTLAELLDRAASKIDGAFPDQPLVEASIRTTIGSTYVLLAFANKGIPHLRRAYELRLDVLGPNHPDTLSSVSGVAQALYNDDRHVEAEQLLRPAVERARATVGVEHERTLSLLNHLAATLYYQWRREETAQIAEEIYRVNLRVHGPDAVPTIVASESFATALTSIGRYDEAERLIRDALARHPPDPQFRAKRLCHTWLKLGAVLASQGKFVEAEDAFTKCVQTRVALYGPEHNMVAFAKLQLANVKEPLGKHEEAERLAEDAIAIDEAERPDSTAMLNSYLCAARLYKLHGKPESADEMLRKAKRIAEAKLATDALPDPLCIITSGTALFELGYNTDAADYLDRAIAHATPVLGTEHAGLKRIMQLRDRARARAATTQPIP